MKSVKASDSRFLDVVGAVVKLAEVLEVPPSEIIKRMEREIGEEA